MLHMQSALLTAWWYCLPVQLNLFVAVLKMQFSKSESNHLRQDSLPHQHFNIIQRVWLFLQVRIGEYIHKQQLAASRNLSVVLDQVQNDADVTAGENAVLQFHAQPDKFSNIRKTVSGTGEPVSNGKQGAGKQATHPSGDDGVPCMWGPQDSSGDTEDVEGVVYVAAIVKPILQVAVVEQLQQQQQQPLTPRSQAKLSRLDSDCQASGCVEAARRVNQSHEQQTNQEKQRHAVWQDAADAHMESVAQQHETMQPAKGDQVRRTAFMSLL